MNKKADFQIRALKRFGVIPVFEGEPAFTQVKTSVQGETFKQWCIRVIGKSAKEVSLFGIYQPTGNARIGRLNQDAEPLKDIIRHQFRKGFAKGLKKANGKNANESEDAFTTTEAQFINHQELYETMADAAPGRSKALDEFFSRFADKHANKGNWPDIFESLVQEYEILAKHITKSNHEKISSKLNLD